MAFEFAPNNNEASKKLFTGRTKAINQIINYILSGNCVALFAERRGGKTLTLHILEDIINGSILAYKEEIIDQTFYKALPKWQNNLASFKALHISLHGTRKESDLVDKFTQEAEKVLNLSFSSILEGANTDSLRLFEILNQCEVVPASIEVN